MNLNNNLTRSDFDYELIENVLVVYDLNKGNRSVTNDIERVLNFLTEKVPDMANKEIIYRDSRGIYDGVKIDETCRFLNFFSVNEMLLGKALEKIRTKMY